VILAKVVALAAMVICLCGAIAAQAPPLGIVELPLPPLVAGVEFRTQLHATGGVPPYVWSVASGDLPDGLTLTPEGCICGRPTKPGTFTAVLKVEDSGHPAHSITKDFRATVSAALLLEWLEFPKVHDSRIDGAVQVTNGMQDTLDLTVIIVAVAENGRATAIGYEHFPLKPGASNVPISFGNTLPHGAYVIHADAIAEIAVRNSILRQRLQTPQALPIAAGP
jgi:Putative Ig domain